MNLRFLMILIASMAIAFTGCKKETTVPANPVSGPEDYRVKNLSFLDSAGTVQQVNTYYYDAQGRLTRLVMDHGLTQTALFTYAPNGSTYRMYDWENKLLMITQYSLNNQGYAFESLQTQYLPNGDTTIYLNKYNFSSDGFLTRGEVSVPDISPDPFLVHIYTVVNGNTTMMKICSTIDTLAESYTYYDNTINTTASINTGRGYLGKTSTNLRKTILSDNKVVASYVYEFDELNRVKKMTLTGNSLIMPVYSKSRTYTYY